MWRKAAVTYALKLGVGRTYYGEDWQLIFLNAIPYATWWSALARPLYWLFFSCVTCIISRLIADANTRASVELLYVYCFLRFIRTFALVKFIFLQINAVKWSEKHLFNCFTLKETSESIKQWEKLEIKDHRKNI